MYTAESFSVEKTDAADAKRRLRAQLREKRAGLSARYKNEASDKIQQYVINSQEFLSAETVFIYISTPDEPDTRMIIKQALRLNKKVYVPKCISKGIMEAVRFNEGTLLSRGYMGISEPDSSDEKAENIDLSVIPCVSCSSDGKRLGHGGGFYDIFLSKYETKKICLCFDKLISDNIPSDEHDILMDKIITEKTPVTAE